MITFIRAQAIATILGYEATLLHDEDFGIYLLTNPAGRSIVLRGKTTWNSDPKRIYVSGHWPQRGLHGSSVTPSSINEISPTISIADSKSDAQVAKEITARFLPDFERIYDLCQARMEEDMSSEAKELAMKKRIMAVMGKPLTDHESRPGNRLNLSGFPDSTYLRDVNVSAYNGCVSFSASGIPVDIFINILKSLK